MSALQRRVREDRGLLLDTLNTVYPRGLSHTDILDILTDLPLPIAADDANRDLTYLQGRGLIERFEGDHRTHRTKTWYWRLTPAGLSFVEAGKDWEKLEGGN